MLDVGLSWSHRVLRKEGRKDFYKRIVVSPRFPLDIYSGRAVD